MTQTSSTFSFADLRLRAGLTVPQAADLLGYTTRTVYRWERGESEPRKAAVEQLRSAVREPVASYETGRPEFTFIDLFAGIGGIGRGFEAVGGRCVFTSEWDKYCQKTYLANFRR